MIRNGANLDYEDAHTALLATAVRRGHRATKYLLGHGAKVNAVDVDGRTALMILMQLIGCEITHDRTLKVLLSFRADVNQMDKLGKTALTHLVCNGAGSAHSSYIAAAANSLLRCGADVNKFGDKYSTLAHAVRYNNRLPLLETLIAHGKNLIESL